MALSSCVVAARPVQRAVGAQADAEGVAGDTDDAGVGEAAKEGVGLSGT
jgi:hypothetical protein